MCMKTQPFRQYRRISGAPGRKITCWDSIGYELRSAHHRFRETIFSLQVYPRMCMKTNNEIWLTPPRSQNVDDNKAVICISQNVTERKELTGSNPRKIKAFPQRRQSSAVAAVYERWESLIQRPAVIDRRYSKSLPPSRKRPVLSRS